VYFKAIHQLGTAISPLEGEFRMLKRTLTALILGLTVSVVPVLAQQAQTMQGGMMESDKMKDDQMKPDKMKPNKMSKQHKRSKHRKHKAMQKMAGNKM
jgi:pentapeptide MXKDX repeat protein